MSVPLWPEAFPGGVPGRSAVFVQGGGKRGDLEPHDSWVASPPVQRARSHLPRRTVARRPANGAAGAYRRLGDLALFLLGVFPDHCPTSPAPAVTHSCASPALQARALAGDKRCQDTPAAPRRPVCHPVVSRSGGSCPDARCSALLDEGNLIRTGGGAVDGGGIPVPRPAGDWSAEGLPWERCTCSNRPCLQSAASGSTGSAACGWRASLAAKVGSRGVVRRRSVAALGAPLRHDVGGRWSDPDREDHRSSLSGQHDPGGLYDLGGLCPGRLR